MSGEKRVKIWNDTKFNIGVKDSRGFGYNIKPGTFTPFPVSEVEFMVAMSRKVFEEPHRLRIDDEETKIQCGLSTAKPHATPDKKDIKEKLGVTASKLSDWLDGISEPHMLDLICDVALADENFPMSKLNVLKKKVPARFQIDD